MLRTAQTPRPGWQAKVESQGFHFHSIDPDGKDLAGQTDQFLYWREDVAYQFTAAQIETLYEATQEVHAMCMDLCQDVFRRGDLARLGMTPLAQALAHQSWLYRDPHLYGRFDVAWNGQGPPRFLEYNADTPTSLIESAVVQWFWKEDVHPSADQFNSIHEALVARLSAIKAQKGLTRLHMAGMVESQEDTGNLEYLMDVALQAGLESGIVDMADIGRTGDGQFVDLQGERIEALFKLYPWEWLAADPFANDIGASATLWLEPAWKQVLANKAMWALLWERHTGHPLLLPTYFEPQGLNGQPFVKKPFLSREGANVELFDAHGQRTLAVDGGYGAEGHVYQALAPVARFAAPEATSWHGPQEAMYAVLGTWVVGDEAVGLAVREDISPVTKNSAYFVPHFFTD